ncbi:hypothetical protein H8959_002192 [Pygathrix nigripes]
MTEGEIPPDGKDGISRVDMEKQVFPRVQFFICYLRKGQRGIKGRGSNHFPGMRTSEDLAFRIPWRDTPGIHTMAIQSITSCSPDLQNVLFGHMLLSGGTGSCPGLRFRMQREISELVSPTVYVKVATCPYSIYGAWVGGSILCSLSTFKDMWVTGKEYKEMGPSIISRNSF